MYDLSFPNLATHAIDLLLVYAVFMKLSRALIAKQLVITMYIWRNFREYLLESE